MKHNRTNAQTSDKKLSRSQAVAIHYSETDELPRVLAKGAGELAKKIIAVAEEHGIPVQEDKRLSALLQSFNAGAAIPPDTYELVAEIICFLYHLDSEWREKHPALSSTLLG